MKTKWDIVYSIIISEQYGFDHYEKLIEHIKSTFLDIFETRILQ